MTISQRLDLRQSQTLVMTPQLQQAIKLLQMSNQELTDFVAQEIEENPLLEQADDSGEEAAGMAATGTEAENLAPVPAESEPAPLSGDTSQPEGEDWHEEHYSGEEAFASSH